jgi:hypothetical protein
LVSNRADFLGSLFLTILACKSQVKLLNLRVDSTTIQRYRDGNLLRANIDARRIRAPTPSICALASLFASP